MTAVNHSEVMDQGGVLLSRYVALILATYRGAAALPERLRRRSCNACDRFAVTELGTYPAQHE